MNEIDIERAVKQLTEALPGWSVTVDSGLGWAGARLVRDGADMTIEASPGGTSCAMILVGSDIGDGASSTRIGRITHDTLPAWAALEAARLIASIPILARAAAELAALEVANG